MRITRILKRLALAVFASVAVAVVAIYVLSERKLNARYDVPASELAISTAHASIERGEHLVRSVGACTLCHGDDMAVAFTQTWGRSASSPART